MAEPSQDRSDGPGGPLEVLVVEDDVGVRTLVALHLRRGGFRVREAGDAAEARTQLGAVQAMVLDRMLPRESGDDLLRWVRAAPGLQDLPVLLLTARASEADRVEGLEGGADDYLVKPFSAPELVARIRALLRRTRSAGRTVVGSLVIDPKEGRVFHREEELALTRREFELLAHLAMYPGRVFARAELLDRVWGEDFIGTERTVDQHVAQLRARVGEGLIETVRGRGYRMVDRHA